MQYPGSSHASPSRAAPSARAEDGVPSHAGSGAQALVSTSLDVATPAEARIYGTRGRIEVDPLFLMPGGFAQLVLRVRRLFTTTKRRYTRHTVGEGTTQRSDT